MNRTLFQMVAGAGLLLFSIAGSRAIAQQYNDNDEWHHNRDSFYADQNWRQHMFDRVRDDLQHVQTVDFGGAGDQYRIVRTMQEITELQGKMAARQYDAGKLDDVIQSLQRVDVDNRISPRDRDMLSDDINRLQDYRAHHDDWR